MNPSSREVLGKAGARLAHEIKNSLAGIVGALQVLQDHLSHSSEVDEILQRVDAEVRRIEGSVKELSDIAEPKSPVLQQKDLRASIRDTGRGVPAEELERIFEPFFTSKMRGLGLGLAITRTLDDAHGGQLSVVSPAEGGTEFVIVLPHTA